MWQIHRVATREVKTESTWEISFFWKLLKEVLGEIMYTENWKFNQKAIIVDKNGANYYSIKDVFGLEFINLQL